MSSFIGLIFIGALAILSSDPEICPKIVKYCGIDVLLDLLVDEDGDLQHRAAEVMKNLCQDESTAELVASKQGALAIMKCIATSTSTAAKEAASKALEKLSEFDLIEMN